MQYADSRIIIQAWLRIQESARSNVLNPGIRALADSESRSGEPRGSKLKSQKSTADGKIGDRSVQKKIAKRAGPRPGVVREFIEGKSTLVGI